MKGAGSKPTTAAPSGRDRTTLQRVAPIVLTVVGIAFITVRFVSGARDTLARTRDGACIALQPDPLPDASGHMVSLSQQRGHPVLLNFWATWCPPCVDEVPSLEDLAHRLDGTDMRMLAVSVDDDWDKVRRFFANGTKMGVLLDLSHDIPKKFGTEKYPETFMIDAAGRVRYYFINKRDWSRPEAVACLESLR